MSVLYRSEATGTRTHMHSIMCYTLHMPIEWTKIYRRFKGLWIALGDDESTVLGSGKTAREALEKARKKGYEKPILTHMPDQLGTYIGL